jgi:hypothetical protein
VTTPPGPSCRPARNGGGAQAGANARHELPTRGEIARAVPGNSRRVQSQPAFLAACATEPDLGMASLRHQHNLMEFARILARHAAWDTRCTRPTRQRVCAAAGFSVSTYKACRRWWEARGYLGTVREGWTPLLRAASLVDGDENAAAIYVLCVPRKRLAAPPLPKCPVTRPLTRSRRELVHPYARDPGAQVKVKGGKAAARAATHFPAQVAALRKGPGQTLSDAWIAHIARPFLAAEWSPGDLTHAVEHKREGGRHNGWLRNVRNPAAWLAWRLSHWLDPEGKPYPSPSQARAAAAAELRAAQDAERAERGELAARRAEPAAYAAAIRAQFGWKRRPGLEPVSVAPEPVAQHEAHRAADVRADQRGEP